MRIYPWMHTRNRAFFAKSGHFFLFAVQLEVLYVNFLLKWSPGKKYIVNITEPNQSASNQPASCRDWSRLPYLRAKLECPLAPNKSLFRVIGRVTFCLLLKLLEMVRNNVLSIIELVYVDEDERCDQRVSICFQVLSNSEEFH